MDKGKESRKGKHLSFEERRQIAALVQEGYSAYKIAKLLGRASNTIRNELKRGTINVIVGYYEKEKYFADTGETVYKKNRERCRKSMKLESCAAFIRYVENKVLNEKRSFASALAEAIQRNIFKKGEVMSVSTLYAYMDRGLLNIKNIDLPEKVGRKVKRKRIVRTHKRVRGTSIEKRMEHINNRKQFGHWEIDLVIGKRSNDKVLLVLTERKTRKEIIRKISGKTSAAVMRKLKEIIKETPCSDEVFKSITTDNGTEFSNLYKLEKRGIKVYYAHPYSSWERGTNENTNKIIRRFVKKFTPIKDYTKGEIEEVETWINTMYRKVLGWKTAEQCYNEEIAKISSCTA